MSKGERTCIKPAPARRWHPRPPSKVRQQIPGELRPNQVEALLHALRDIVGALAAADPADKADLHRNLASPYATTPAAPSLCRLNPVG